MLKSAHLWHGSSNQIEGGEFPTPCSNYGNDFIPELKVFSTIRQMKLLIAFFWLIMLATHKGISTVSSPDSNYAQLGPIRFSPIALHNQPAPGRTRRALPVSTAKGSRLQCQSAATATAPVGWATGTTCARRGEGRETLLSGGWSWGDPPTKTGQVFDPNNGYTEWGSYGISRFDLPGLKIRSGTEICSGEQEKEYSNVRK